MPRQPDSLSDTGIALIKRFEGLRLEAYQDEGGVWTIGYGHTKGVKRGHTITEEQAEAFLREDLASVRKAIKLYVKVPLSQRQYDALASWTFNLGVGNLRSSTLLKVINRRDYEGVPEQIVRWNKVKVDGKFKVSRGLVRRRTAEAAMFAMDAPFASDGGEPMVQKPRAVDEGTKPLKKSRTLWGAGAAAIGATLTATAEQLQPLVGTVPQLEWAAVGLTIAGILAVAYARVDDQLSKLR